MLMEAHGRCVLLGALLLAARIQRGSASDAAGEAFLAQNGAKPGVVTLPSGLQYKVLRHGGGTYHPRYDTPCSCNYAGTLIDGTEFDSSYARGTPTTFAPNQVIRGWTIAMQLMVEGDKFQLVIPSELAYGQRGAPPMIGAGNVLVFTLEMLEINCKTISQPGCNVGTGNTTCNGGVCTTCTICGGPGGVSVIQVVLIVGALGLCACAVPWLRGAWLGLRQSWKEKAMKGKHAEEYTPLSVVDVDSDDSDEDSAPATI